MKVIKFIHQIMIVDGFDLPDNNSPFFKENELNLRRLHNTASYKLWSGNDIREFLKKNFSKDILETFDTLKPYAYKADLARLCILYVYGGLYIDLGVRLLRPFLVPKGKDFCAFRDLYEPTCWFTVMNCILFSEPKRMELQYNIRFIVENRNNNYYGHHLLFPTGPVQLGRAVARVAVEAGPGGDPSQWIGESKPITPGQKNRNITYMVPSGEIYALRAKTSDADLSHMGLRGGNNYLDLWDRRRIYGESTTFWSFDYDRIRVSNAVKTKKGILPNKFGHKLITWGPFFSLEKGNYIFRLHLSDKVFFNKMLLEVTAHPNSTSYGKKTFSYFDIENFSLNLKFDVSERIDAVELKTYTGGIFLGYIIGFEILDVK